MLKLFYTTLIIIMFIILYILLINNIINHRMILIILIILTITITMSLSIGDSGRSQFLVASVGLLGAYLTTFRSWSDFPTLTRGDIRSEQLWSITLQTPEHAIRRILPLPGEAPIYRVRVALDRDYRGMSYVTASLAGIDLGRLHPEGTQRGLTRTDNMLEIIFDPAIINSRNAIEVVIRQPIPDANLRIMVIGAVRGLVHGENSVEFGVKSQWLRGMPFASTGELVSGLPLVWLDGVY